MKEVWTGHKQHLYGRTQKLECNIRVKHVIIQLPNCSVLTIVCKFTGCVVYLSLLILPFDVFILNMLF